ncbi:hypothetical protein K469DRAFT_687895 [Zopfia rhizophila CBS 207.26]|uniref:Uncharacterized protein n=1 Tax=Zopfia rhizophila CBS 207.26 TaxID=1314779 RepID=A0A6A6E4Y3_9PEZI|nr:hypothetical protein K469DRAFT_687895 [Zopfia rhizophila CBS 207.26]
MSPSAMEKFVRTSQRVSASQALSSSKGKEPWQPYHSAASKQLTRAQAATPGASPSSPAESPQSSPCASFSHEYPDDGLFNSGIAFEIDWEHIWRSSTERLASHRLGYWVKHKSQL